MGRKHAVRHKKRVLRERKRNMKTKGEKKRGREGESIFKNCLILTCIVMSKH